MCYTCERLGHFSNRCPDKPRRPNVRRPGPSESSSSQSQSAKPLGSSKRDEVKLVTTAPSFDSSDDSDFSFAVSSSSSRLPAQLEANRMPILVGGVPTSMYVDSMASRALFDASTWRSLVQQGVVFSEAVVSRNLFPYGQTQPLNVDKAVVVEFRSGSKSVTAKAYVLGESEGRCEAILGSKVAKELGVLRVGCPRWTSRAAHDEAIYSLVAQNSAHVKPAT
ncbi:unnamed protein product, partial [Ilex paraguariensis]